MALSQSALSELLEAFRTGDGVDMIRESVRTVLQELVEFVTPIQERHLSDTMEGSLKLAAEEDPNEIA